MWAAAMLGRCWSSQSGKIDSDRAWANRAMSKAPSVPMLCEDRRDELADIDRRDPRPHARRQTGRGRACRCRGPSPPRPCAAAPTANRTARLISFAFFLCSPRYGETSKFLTSPAILIGRPDGVEALDVRRRRNAPRGWPR